MTEPANRPSPAILATSGGWFRAACRELLERHGSNTQPLSRALVGAWICHEVAGNDRSARELSELAGSAAPQLVAAPIGDELPWDSAMALRLAKRIAATYGPEALADATHEPRGPLPRVTLEGVAENAFELIGAPPRTLLAVAQRIFEASDSGLRRPRVERTLRQELRAALAPIVLELLRGYQLELGATLLRSLTYIGAGTGQSVGFATAFLATQQQPDGRIGYLDLEIARAGRLGGLDPIQNVYLPTTLAAVWVLAEAVTPSWRVVRAAAG